VSLPDLARAAHLFTQSILQTHACNDGQAPRDSKQLRQNESTEPARKPIVATSPAPCYWSSELELSLIHEHIEIGVANMPERVAFLT
jgi:hypothetical protein